jgi:hypothetical protein
MVMMRPWLLTSKVSPRKSKKLLRVMLMLKLKAPRKMLKLMRTLKELRCEGVNFTALRLVFCKDILAHLRLHTFCDMG